MVRVITFLFLLICSFVFGQNSEEAEVKVTINHFFEGFHKQDSLMIKEVMGETPTMQSVGVTKEKEPFMRSQDFSEFLKSIVSIPKDKNFQEKLLDYKIQVDGNMAHAWTPYEFWFDGAFSHCGVNSFQLFKAKDGWKIVSIMDTRHREGCGK
ncbi:nuclear transport factor 2 family protein [Leptobacterium sp. I13]|uniref:nuclear transport factor 2 family protein n=1 Tax=Leptobacterium meishanense TaxID=3128904 RepID=UPI0030EBFFFA